MASEHALAQRVRDWGQVILIACAIGGGALTFTSKAWGWFNAGPVALTKAQQLEKDVWRLKRRSRFTVEVMEKLSRTKYDWKAEERELAQDSE